MLPNIYRIVASTNTCYYSENQLFVKRTQYIRIKNPFHNQSDKAAWASKQDVLELMTFQYVLNHTFKVMKSYLSF